MGARRGGGLSRLGGQTPATLRAFQGFLMVMPHPAMTTTSLLLVEDDEFVRLSLARALNRSGVFSVLPAENGQQALELLDGQQVDAILTDLQMPVMDGLTLLGHLLERGAGLPVAVMTGHRITLDLRERLQQYGIAATFTKPIDISFLADELQRSLSPATVGRMAGITLFGFLQLIEVEQKTGLIVVRAAGGEGRIYFDHWRPAHAETRRAHGPAAVYEIVRWTDPKLEIFYKRTPRERTIKESLQHILMEAARLLDESGPGAPARDGGGTHQEPATPVEPRRPEVQAALAEAMTMDGALGIALIDAANGLSLGTAGGSPMVNLELAGAAAADLVRTKLRAMTTLGLKDAIEDVMITFGKQYHLIRFLGPEQNLFLYVVLDRERSNLGMARHKLAAIGRLIAP